MENNNNEEEYCIKTFGEVFDQIGYAHEAQYPCYLDYRDGVGYFNVYKLTITSEGEMEYKGNITKYDVKLWPRIELLAKVMTNDPTINLLYLNEDK